MNALFRIILFRKEKEPRDGVAVGPSLPDRELPLPSHEMHFVGLREANPFARGLGRDLRVGSK